MSTLSCVLSSLFAVATPEAGGTSSPPATSSPAVVIHGFAQIDAVFFHGSSIDEIDPGTGQPLNETRLLVRRGRLRAEVKDELPALHVGAVLELEGNTVQSPVVLLQKGWIEAALPAPTGVLPLLRARAGLMKIPFGGELLDEPAERLFAEQALVSRALFPGEHDLGLRLDGAWGLLRGSLAAMNGQPTGMLSFPTLDPDAGKDVVGRVGVDGELDVGARVQIRAGVSGLAGTGLHVGQRPTKDTLAWRDQNEDGVAQAVELTVIPAQPSEPSSSFARSALGADARAVTAVPGLGALLVEGEITFAVNLDRGFAVADPVATGRDQRGLGWRVLVTQELTTWATVGVRYDEYNPDLDALNERAGRVLATDATVATWAFAAAVRLPARARLLVEYAHEDNALGRTTAGVPTTLPADRMLARVEVVF
jgi:hypothetical protein